MCSSYLSWRCIIFFVIKYVCRAPFHVEEKMFNLSMYMFNSNKYFLLIFLLLSEFFQNSFQKNNERNCNVYFLFDVPCLMFLLSTILLNIYICVKCTLVTVMYTSVSCTLCTLIVHWLSMYNVHSWVIYFQWSNFLYFLLSKSYDLIECMNMNQKKYSIRREKIFAVLSLSNIKRLK